MNPGSVDPGWLQWAISGVLAVYGAALVWLANRVESMKRDASTASAEATKQAAAGDDKLWDEIGRLRQTVDRHREESHTMHLANTTRLGDMPTRAELRAELDRFAGMIRRGVDG